MTHRGRVAERGTTRPRRGWHKGGRRRTARRPRGGRRRGGGRGGGVRREGRAPEAAAKTDEGTAPLPLGRENKGDGVDLHKPEEKDGSDSNGDSSDPDASDPQLIVSPGSDQSSSHGGSSYGTGGSQDYVKIVQTKMGDAMTESEFLALHRGNDDDEGGRRGRE